MRQFKDWLTDRTLRGLIWLMLQLPYAMRVRLMGWISRSLLGPLAGYNKRIRDNLNFVFPEMPEGEARQVTSDVLDNVGRTMIEFYSVRDFADLLRRTELSGPGIKAIEAAQKAGQPVLILSGHFGNYQAPRAALAVRGYSVAGLYRPMNNRYFNRHYVAMNEAIAKPLFARSPKGIAGLIKHLKAGGIGGLLIDQYLHEGATLGFFGKPAPTALSAAEIALKYNALLVPVYGIRQPDGLSFNLIYEEPIPHTDSKTMTQAFNDSLEARVRDNMGQWFWIHRRWKPERQLT